MRISSKVVVAGLTLFATIMVCFQNCGPAKVSSNGDLSSATGDNSFILPSSDIGLKVDLAPIMNAPQETASNVIYPASTSIQDKYYINNAPVLENIILRNNTFDKIYWVHAPSSTVVAVGDSLTQTKFSSALAGLYFVVGYRNQSPFLISQYRISFRTSASLSLNSVGAVQVAKTQVAADSMNEWYLLAVNAPDVDIANIQFITPNGPSTYDRKRAILVSKKLGDSVSIQINLMDITGQNMSASVTLAGAPTPTPTPTPYPDIVVTSISMSPASPIAGQAVTFSAVVKNQGNASVRSGVLLGLSFQVDGVEVSWSDSYTGSLAPGASVTLTASGGPFFNSSTYKAVAGSHTLLAWANNDAIFVESNPDNNKLIIPFMVSPASTPTPSPTPLPSPVSLFANTVQPDTVAATDLGAIEVGMKFQSTKSGMISAIRFYRGVDCPAGFIVNLYTSSGTLLGTGFVGPGQKMPGWMTVSLSTPVAIAANTYYVASYYSANGQYADTVGGFSAAITNGPLTAPAATSSTSGNGLFRYGGGFPSSSYGMSNYFVDVVFNPN